MKKKAVSKKKKTQPSIFLRIDSTNGAENFQYYFPTFVLYKQTRAFFLSTIRGRCVFFYLLKTLFFFLGNIRKMIIIFQVQTVFQIPRIEIYSRVGWSKLQNFSSRPTKRSKKSEHEKAQKAWQKSILCPPSTVSKNWSEMKNDPEKKFSFGK